MSRTLKWIIGIIVVIIAVLIALYFIFVPSIEKKHEERIRSEIAMIPGASVESVKVGFLTNSLEIKGFKISTTAMDDTMTMNYEVKRISGSGFNLKAQENPGVQDLADSLDFEDITMRYDMDITDALTVNQVSTIKKMSVQDVRGDAVKSMELLGQEITLATLIEAFRSYHFGSISAEQYNSTMQMGKMTTTSSIQSMESQDMTLLSCGKSTWTNLSAESSGTKINIKEMSVGQMSVPDILLPALTMESGADEEKAANDILKIMATEPMRFKDLQLTDLNISIDRMPPMTLDKIYLDLDSTTANGALKFNFSGFTLPVELYSIGREGRQLAEIYNKPIILDGALEGEAKRTGTKVDLALTNMSLSEKNLGSISSSANLFLDGEGQDFIDLFTYPVETFLKNATLTVDDKGFMQLWFEMQSKDNGMPAAEQLRTRYAEMIKMWAAQDNDQNLRAIAPGLVQLLQGPGILKISANPAEPVNFDYIDDTDLNCSVEFTPAADQSAVKQ